MEPKIGDRYGRLVIIEVTKVTRGYRIRLQCDCGGQTTDRWYEVQRGKRKTCGCSRRHGEQRRLTTGGYRAIYHDGKDRFEHRWIMEQHLGRLLSRDEVVHHVNGIRTDNRIENLLVMNRADHHLCHAEKLRLIVVLRCENARLRRRIAELTNP